MRFEVPQFIDIEDKIFGPLTWKQFLYLGGGVGMSVVIFLTTNFWVFIFVGLPLAILSLALSFYNINNRPFSYFLEAMFNYLTRQRIYFWKKKDGPIYTKRVAKQGAAQQLPIKKSGQDISAMARRLELKALEKDN
jgi:hypothetical protein